MKRHHHIHHHHDLGHNSRAAIAVAFAVVLTAAVIGVIRLSAPPQEMSHVLPVSVGQAETVVLPTVVVHARMPAAALSVTRLPTVIVHGRSSNAIVALEADEWSAPTTLDTDPRQVAWSMPYYSFGATMTR